MFEGGILPQDFILCTFIGKAVKNCRDQNPCASYTRFTMAYRWINRNSLSPVLDNFADECTESEILQQYPSLKHDDIRAAVGYGAELARERMIYLDAA